MSWLCSHCGLKNADWRTSGCVDCRMPKDTPKLYPPLNTPFMEHMAKHPEAADGVNQPAHYSRWKMQPIEFIAINDLPFWVANVIKYTMRYDAKNGLEDLYKARSYLDIKIRELEGAERYWEKPVSEERKLNGK